MYGIKERPSFLKDVARINRLKKVNMENKNFDRPLKYSILFQKLAMFFLYNFIIHIDMWLDFTSIKYIILISSFIITY